MYLVANAFKKAKKKTLENIRVFSGCFLVISGHKILNQLKSNAILRPNRKQYEAINQLYYYKYTLHIVNMRENKMNTSTYYAHSVGSHLF